MARANTTGRTKNEQFIRLHRGVTNSDAWKSLSCEARSLLLEVWARHNGSNNGRIPLGRKEARKALRIGSRKLKNAFRDAQDRGFLIERQKGSFNFKVAAGKGRATEWEITTEKCDNRPPKRLYRDWPEKQNTGTTVVTAGNHGGHRFEPTGPQKGSNGNHSSDRSGHSRGSNGNHCGDTSNIPGEHDDACPCRSFDQPAPTPKGVRVLLGHADTSEGLGREQN